MKLMTRAATVAIMAIAASSSLRADTNTNSAVGTGKDVKAPVVPAPTAASPLFNYTFTEEYDSRYMFRGVNVLPNTGILWTEFDPVWHITANDNLSVPLAYGVALGKTYTAGLENYRELDVPVSYTHAIGNWTLGAGYQLYAYFNLPGYHPGGQGIQNEVNANVSYTWKTGIVTWTPAVFYYYELGTAVPYNYGSVYAGSSFLSPQLTASVPLNSSGSITFNPNLQYNFSFKYNANYLGDAYTGANNFQIQAPLTWQLTKIVSVTGYVAYSYTGANLAGTGGRTSPSTVWAGANVTLSF
jgi:hypothetical protein